MDAIIKYPRARQGAYVMPYQVTTVKERSLNSCLQLKSITLSDNLTTIEQYGFCGMGASSITVPEKVTSIGKYAFTECNSLVSVRLMCRGAKIANSAFSCCGSLATVEVGEGVSEIDEYAFFNCKSLSSVILPISLTSIGKCAFQQCDALRIIDIPYGVAEIKASTFERCKSLSNVTLHDGLIRIEQNAFNSTSIKNIKLPYSLQSISDSALPCGEALYGEPVIIYVPRGKYYGLSSYGRRLIEY